MRGCNKCECEFPPHSQLLETQLKYYVRGDESRRAQNAIIEFTISLKMRKRNLYTTHLNVGLRYVMYSMLAVAQIRAFSTPIQNFEDNNNLTRGWLTPPGTITFWLTSELGFQNPSVVSFGLQVVLVFSPPPIQQDPSMNVIYMCVWHCVCISMYVYPAYVWPLKVMWIYTTSMLSLCTSFWMAAFHLFLAMCACWLKSSMSSSGLWPRLRMGKFEKLMCWGEGLCVGDSTGDDCPLGNEFRCGEGLLLLGGDCLIGDECALWRGDFRDVWVCESCDPCEDRLLLSSSRGSSFMDVEGEVTVMKGGVEGMGELEVEEEVEEW